MIAMMMMMCSDIFAAWSRDKCACDAAVDINPDDACKWFDDDRSALFGVAISASCGVAVAAAALSASFATVDNVEIYIDWLHVAAASVAISPFNADAFDAALIAYCGWQLLEYVAIQLPYVAYVAKVHVEV